MPAGHNVSRGIYIRLRRYESHDFISYDEIAGVMAHEMSHIVHGNHSAEFYEVTIVYLWGYIHIAGLDIIVRHICIYIFISKGEYEGNFLMAQELLFTSLQLISYQLHPMQLPSYQLMEEIQEQHAQYLIRYILTFF